LIKYVISINSGELFPRVGRHLMVRYPQLD
jgi:hypothetical protein